MNANLHVGDCIYPHPIGEKCEELVTMYVWTFCKINSDISLSLSQNLLVLSEEKGFSSWFDWCDSSNELEGD